jgi:diguanylate cyclase (GGDEF)-like protein/PAS domain S-box-containing protein
MSPKRYRPVRLLIGCGSLLVAAIIAATAAIMYNGRDRALAESERELKNTALILAAQTDRSFQSLELVLGSLIERFQSLEIRSREDFEAKLSGPDVQRMLQDKISGLPHIDALTLINAEGKVINFSRYWPAPDISIADRNHFLAFTSDPMLNSLISEPLQNRGTGSWTIFVVRRLSAANGEFLGLVHGSIALEHFETFFSSIVLGDHSSISLYRGDGLLLARHPRSEAAIGRPFTAAVTALKGRDSASVRYRGRMEVKDRLLAAHRLAHFPLFISVAADMDAVLTGWHKDARILAAAGLLLVCVTGVMFFIVVRLLLRNSLRSRQRLAQEKLRLRTAIGNMSQGLLLFDASERIVVCNERYVAMYGLSPDVAKPGCRFRDLLMHRKATGSFPGDVDEYLDKLRGDLAQKKISEAVAHTASGRIIRIVNQPVGDGGWVATHEDITEREHLLQAQNAAERSLREQKLQLDAALNNMTHALCMFDAQGRIVLFNKRYEDMMELPAERLRGLSLLDLFKYRKSVGRFTGDPEPFFERTLGAARAGESTTKIMVGSDGRALRVIDHPMGNGGWVATFEDITEQRALERERDQNREFLNLIIDNVPVMIAVKDAVTRKYVLVNRAAESMWKIPRAQALGKTASELFSPAQAEIIDTYDDQALRSDMPLVLDAHPNMARSGGKKTVTSKRLALRATDGAATFLVSVVEDVTERKQLEEERDRDREFLDQIIHNVPATIIVKDIESQRYILVNRAGEELFNVSRDQIIGKTTHEVFPKAAADIIAGHDEEMLHSGGALSFGEFPLEIFGREPRIITSKKLLVRNTDGTPRFLLGVIEDITERKRSEERIAHLAHHDALTGLPNRALFREQLDQSLKWVQRGERLAVLFVDLDHFKAVNDTFGHPIGDELLKVAADRLRRCVQDTDVIARLGGDEFAIIQTAISGPADVTRLVNRIGEALREPCELGGHQLMAGTSIGIALAPEDATDSVQLVKNADLAMYRAKAEGRGTYRFFEPEMDARIKARRALEIDLREALMGGAFELHYQPLVNLQDGRVTGCEALLRWQHPVRGPVSPAEFVSVAEETGLINPIGEWVLRTACTEAAVWPDDIKIAVNVSPVQFKSGHLVQMVINALASSRLPAHRLELEITEAVLIRDDEAALAILHQLRALGVRIAMDDFGTGYSSLGYLQRFPFDKIKIDRSFVKDVAAEAGSLSIVQAVIGIAKARKITTTAEGVETVEQRDTLRRLGCTEMQGYLFSPAIPATALRALIVPRRAKAAGAT